MKSEVAGARARDSVSCCLIDLLPCCLCQLPPKDDGFTCLQSFLTDCMTKGPTVKVEDAGARTRDSVSCFVTFDGCGVVCVSSDSMLTVFSGVFNAF